MEASRECGASKIKLVANNYRKGFLLIDAIHSAQIMMILGVTGGMGCGKSSVARLFEDLGYRRLDSDEIVRMHLLTQGDVISAVCERHGAAAVDADCQINRAFLARRVFSDDTERQWLESLLHPLLFLFWREALASAPRSHWVIEVPLLFEKGLENWFDFTLCVTSTPEQQFVRLEKRGITRAQAESRISKQLPLVRKTELADYVVGNDGSPAFLKRQVTFLAGKLEARIHDCGRP